MNNDGFQKLGLSEESLKAVAIKGFEEPTEIQRKIIPLILKNEVDLIGQAQTGTGKTAAFAIPIIERLQIKPGHLQAIVLVPTRELAIQVSEEFNSLRGQKNIHVTPIYGGQSYDIQLRHLKKGVDVIVGTPGRVIDHLNRGTVSFENVSYVVLDEADEMLNMGFIDDIEDILSRTNKVRRTLLFSATMPDRISMLAKKYMGKREIIKTIKSGQIAELTDQIYFEVKEGDKLDALCRIIDTNSEFYGLVFCRTKLDVDYVTSKLNDRGYDSDGLHGDISQNVREKILTKFRNKKINVLVATDVAARGLDIDDLTHVINYALPQDPEAYLHRIGRTGRAGKEGTAVTFVTPDEFRKLMFIKNFTKTEIRKERVPHVKDVITYKKERIYKKLKDIIDSGTNEKYIEIAQELLKEGKSTVVVAALIKHLFQGELEETNYAKIQDLYDYNSSRKESGREREGDRRGRQNDRPGRKRGDLDGRRRDFNERDGKKRDFSDRDGKKRDFKEDKGKARMFLSLGKKDELTPKGLIKLVRKKAKIDDDDITGIQISEAFSFFNVPKKDADTIIEKLNKGKNDRPLVERAKG
jgi:ATP-dependent RNA helicase DeaD